MFLTNFQQNLTSSKWLGVKPKKQPNFGNWRQTSHGFNGICQRCWPMSGNFSGIWEVLQVWTMVGQNITTNQMATFAPKPDLVENSPGCTHEHTSHHKQGLGAHPCDWRCLTYHCTLHSNAVSADYFRSSKIIIAELLGNFQWISTLARFFQSLS